MICNLKEMLNDAKKNKYAIGAFNTPNLETLCAVINAAEELNSPVILNHAQSFEQVIPVSVIGPLMVEYAKKAKVPVSVNIDHGTDKAYLLKAIQLGFTSVMYDCAALPFEENIAEIAEFVKIAHMMNISVEAELGVMPGSNEVGLSCSKTFVENTADNYTNINQAKRFVEETNVDALAVSIGSIHCLSKEVSQVKLDITRLKELDSQTGDCKIVMHGGSSVSDEEVKKAISNGIRKINYYTYMGSAPAKEIQNLISSHKTVMYHDIASLAEKVMFERCKEAIRLFLNK